MQYADYIIQIPLVYRQTRMMWTGNGLHDAVYIIFNIDAGNFTAGYHDVTDGNFFQIKNIDQHVLVAGRNMRCRLIDDGF